MSSALLSVPEAFACIAQAVQPLGTERLALSEGCGRVLAQPALAACDLPPFDQSAMDGYAARAADIAAAPLSLPLTSTVAAGPQERLPTLAPGQLSRIYTGAMMPLGADTVVMQELTRRDGQRVTVLEPRPAGRDLRRRGEELRAGSVLATAGDRLTPGLVGALSAAGLAEVQVYRRPRISVLVTGDEIVNPPQPLRPGQVYDANGALLSSWLRARGAAAPRLLRVADTAEAVALALEQAFEESDLVISTGGVSVGDRDLVAPGAEALGAERLLWKVAQKPGKPLYVARRGRSLLLGLPGNPASVFVNLVSYGALVLDRFEGLPQVLPDFRWGVLARETASDARRDCWLRCRMEVDAQGRVVLHALTRQASHMLSNLGEANALAWLPASEAALPAGSLARWLPL